MPAWRSVRTNGGENVHAIVGGITVRIAREGRWWTAYLDDSPVADCDTVEEAKSAALDACLEILAGEQKPVTLKTEGGQ